MPFDKIEFAVPERLETESFVLRPILASDDRLDYDAVMESKEFLRLWEQTTWPEDDFTVEANREDLEKLERRHAENGAFTYTVLTNDETECLGCVYIIATNAQMFANATVTPLADRSWEDFEATVYFWVRESRLESGLDRAVLESLRRWFETEWEFDGVLFVTSELFAQQVEMIRAAGLERRFTIAETGKPGPYLAFE